MRTWANSPSRLQPRGARAMRWRETASSADCGRRFAWSRSRCGHTAAPSRSAIPKSCEPVFKKCAPKCSGCLHRRDFWWPPRRVDWHIAAHMSSEVQMKHLLVFLIRVYQKLISPLLPPSCRFYPSCSEYACQAIQKHGVIKGAYLAMRRLLRCHPWHAPGYDPVP